MANQKIVVELELQDGRYVPRIQGAGQLALKFARDLDRLNQSLNRTERGNHGFVESLRDWTLIVGQARNALNQLAFLTTDWMRSIVLANAEVERLTAQMRAFSDAVDIGSQVRDAEASMTRLFDLAEQSPFTINTLADSFVKMKSVGIEPLDGSLQALTDAVATFGGTDQIFSRASIAIQQMAGKGVISMEELRQQLGEAVPQAITMMARALGVDYAKLVDLVSKGIVEADSALKAMFGEFERSYGGNALQLMETFNGQVSQLRTNLIRLVSESDGIQLFTDSVTEIVRQLNEFLGSERASQWANQLGEALALITTNGVAAIETIFEFREVIGEVGSAIAIAFGVRAAAAFGPIGVAIGGLTAAFVAFGGELSDIEDAYNSLTREGSILASALDSLGASAFTASEALYGFAAAALAMLGPLGRAASAVMALNALMSATGASYQEALDAINSNQPIRDADDLRTRRDGLEKLSETVNRLRARVGELGEESEAVEDFMNDRNWSGPIRDALSVGSQSILYLAQEYSKSRSTQLAQEYDAASAQLEKQTRDYIEATTPMFSDMLTKGFEERFQAIADQRNRLVRQIEGDETLNQQQVREKTISATRALYDQQIALARDQRQRLAEIFSMAESDPNRLADAERATGLTGQAAIDLVRRASQRSLDEVDQTIANLVSRQRQAIAFMENGPNLLNNKKRDGELTRMEARITRIMSQFNQLGRDGFQELARSFEAMEDPLIYQLPESFTELENRIGKLRSELVLLAEKSSVAALALQDFDNRTDNIKANAIDTISNIETKTLKDRTTQILRSLMTEDEVRRLNYEDEVKRVTSMRDVLIAAGADRVAIEEATTANLDALRQGFERDTEGAITTWTRDWETAAEDVENAMADAVRGMSQELANFITRGELDLASFAERILNTFLQIQINAGFAALASGINFRGILGLSGGSTAGTPIASGSMPPASAFTLHRGGIAGLGSNVMRSVPTEVFATAPRFHTGGIIGHDEVPAVLRKGEGVFTPEQMAALGSNMGGGDVQVNVINQSGQQMNAEQRQPRFDGRRMILDVVLTAASQPGTFRDGMKSALR